MSIRIMIVDDHAIFRSGLKALLEQASDLEVVAEAGDGFEALRVIPEHDVDVLILDLGLPGLSGTKVAETVLTDDPHQAIVALTMHEDDYYVRELFKIGVRGFVLKKSTGTDLVQAVRAAYRGEQYVDPALAGQVISDLVRPQSTKPAGAVSVLTRREREVCGLLALGLTNSEIAGKLFISERTVETHRASILAKLDLKGRAELVRFSIEHGLLKL